MLFAYLKVMLEEAYTAKKEATDNYRRIYDDIHKLNIRNQIRLERARKQRKNAIIEVNDILDMLYNAQLMMKGFHLKLNAFKLSVGEMKEAQFAFFKALDEPKANETKAKTQEAQTKYSNSIQKLITADRGLTRSLNSLSPQQRAAAEELLRRLLL